MAKPPKNDTRRYRPDSIFKWIMNRQFTRLGIPIQTQVEVGHLPLTIDVVLTPRNETEQQKVKLEIALPDVRPHNLIEFKSENDPLTIFDLQRIEARAKLYMSQNRLLCRDVTITIVCARTPQKVLRHFQEDIKFESLGGGYYRSTDNLPIHIVAINELEVTPKNYPLLMFATSKRKFVAFLRDAMGQAESDDNPVITFAYFLKSDLIKELNMPIKNRLSKEALAFIIEDIGDEILSCFSPDEIASRLSVDERLTGLSAEEVLARFSPEEVLARFSAEEVLARFSAEEVLARFSPEERVAGLSPEERRQLQRLLEQ